MAAKNVNRHKWLPKWIILIHLTQLPEKVTQCDLINYTASGLARILEAAYKQLHAVTPTNTLHTYSTWSSGKDASAFIGTSFSMFFSKFLEDKNVIMLIMRLKNMNTAKLVKKWKLNIFNVWFVISRFLVSQCEIMIFFILFFHLFFSKLFLQLYKWYIYIIKSKNVHTQ